PLRLIMQRTHCLATLSAGRPEGLPEISLAKAHASAGGAQHQGQIVRSFPPALLPRLMSGNQQHLASAVQASQLMGPQLRRRYLFRQIHFRRDLDALPRNVEEGYRAKSSGARAKSRGIELPARSEGRNEPSAGNDYARGRIAAE